MKKLVLVALCSTSLLSVARAGGGGTGGSGDSMHQGDAMKAGDGAGHAGSMAPDSTQAAPETMKKAKVQAKKQGAVSQMKHDGMEHGSMKQDGMGHGSTQQDGMGHGAMKQDGMGHGAMQQDGRTDGGTK